MQNIKIIEKLFDCEPVGEDPKRFSRNIVAGKMEEEIILDQDTVEFLDEREALREEMEWDLSIATYLQSYEKLVRYGLDEYFMEQLKWEIHLKMGGEIGTYFSREFELRFKSQEYMLDLVKII